MQSAQANVEYFNVLEHGNLVEDSSQATGSEKDQNVRIESPPEMEVAKDLRKTNGKEDGPSEQIGERGTVNEGSVPSVQLSDQADGENASFFDQLDPSNIRLTQREIENMNFLSSLQGRAPIIDRSELPSVRTSSSAPMTSASLTVDRDSKRRRTSPGQHTAMNTSIIDQARPQHVQEAQWDQRNQDVQQNKQVLDDVETGGQRYELPPDMQPLSTILPSPILYQHSFANLEFLDNIPELTQSYNVPPRDTQASHVSGQHHDALPQFPSSPEVPETNAYSQLANLETTDTAVIGGWEDSWADGASSFSNFPPANSRFFNDMLDLPSSGEHTNEQQRGGSSERVDRKMVHSNHLPNFLVQGPSHEYERFQQQTGLTNIHFLLGDIGAARPLEPPPVQAPSANMGFLRETAFGQVSPPEKRLKFVREYPALDTARTLPTNAPNMTDCNGPDVRVEINNSRLSTQSQTPFVYKSLSDHTSGTLRLIRFEPTQTSGDTNLNYAIVSFDPWKNLAKDQPWLADVDYHCLSYCWGDSKKTRQIHLRHSIEHTSRYSPFPVTDNLYSALHNLSITHTRKWLWIDAISINQEDLNERSSQVAMMKGIYNKAAGVVIWLGESEAASNACPVISHVSDRFTADTGLQMSSIIDSGGLTLTQEHLDILKQSTTVNIAGKAPMEAYEDLADFFSLPWFRRVWVLQEALSQTAITARMGKLSVPWGAVILAALWQSFLARNYTAESKLPAKPTRQGAGYLPELWLGLVHNRTPKGLSMVELVCRARDFHASDPRDKVFGLLGLANDIDSDADLPNLRPDYTRSTVEVYSGFARDIICKTGTLDILSAINTFTTSPRHTDSPTWMPNLDISLATIRGLGFPPKYNASSSTRASISPTNPAISTHTPSVLSLTGFTLDTVSATISPLLTLRKDLRLYIGTSPNAISALWTDYLFRYYDCDKEATLEAFIHTLTATGFALPTQFPAHPLGKVVPPHRIPSLISDFAAHMQKDQPFSLTHAIPPFPKRDQLQTLATDGDADQFAVLVGKACHERKFFITGEGRMGLCPRGAREGDKVVVLYGGSVLYVLRNIGEGRCSFVGECYVEGWMFGEAEAVRGVGGRTERVFHIV